MKKKNGFILALTAVFVSSLSVLATTHYVDAARPDDSGDGSSWASAKQTIQAAVDLTVNGDTVLVTDGTYDLGGVAVSGQAQPNRVCITLPVTVRSVNGPDFTTILGAAGSNGSNDVDSIRGVCMTTNASLVGFTISGGYTIPDGDYPVYAAPGAGVYLRDGAVVSNCTVSGNSTLSSGGGVYLYNSGLVTHCTIEGNVSQSGGGGVYLSYGGTVSDCILSNNVDEGWNGGGGAKIEGQGGEILRSVIQSNYARSGAGVIMEYGGFLNNCLIIDNMANESGGGVSGSSSMLNNCTMVGNSVTNLTSYSGGGGFVSGMMGENMLNNCILWGNTAVTNANLSLQPWGDSAKYCCVPAGEGIINEVDGCITSDPLFVDASAGNYQIMGSSPCVNAGINEIQTDPYNPDSVTNVMALSATDLAGNLRINNGTVDIGAYEQTTSLPSFVITTSTGANGTISPSSPSVYQGFDQEFLIQPAVAYQIEGLLVDGVAVPVTNRYTFTDVQAAHTLSATFSPASYALSVTDGSGDGSYTNTETIIVSADLPSSGTIFSHWAVVPTEYTNNLASATSVSTTFTMPYEDVALAANYNDIIEVKNVSVAQRPGTKLVDISYDLFCGATNAVEISLAVSNSTVVVNAGSLLGDVGSGIAAGTGLSMLWDMGADWDGNVADLLFTVQGSFGALDSYPGSKIQMVDSRNYILRVSSSEGGGLKSHSGYYQIGNSGGSVRPYPNMNTKGTSYSHRNDREFTSYGSSTVGMDWRFSHYGNMAYVGLSPGAAGGYSHIQIDSATGSMRASASAHNRGGPGYWIDDDGDRRSYSIYQSWGTGGSDGGTHRLYEITGTTPFLITINMSYEGSLSSEAQTSAYAESITLVTLIKDESTYFDEMEPMNWGGASDVFGDTNAYDWIFGDEDQEVAEFLGQLHYSKGLDTSLFGEVNLLGNKTMSFTVHPGDLIMVDDLINVSTMTMNPTVILSTERRARVERFSVTSELLIESGSGGGFIESDQFDPAPVGSPIPSVGTHSDYCWMSAVTCAVNYVSGYTNTGWIGTGSVPAIGGAFGTVPLALSTPDSSIAWDWEFEGYELTVLNGTGSGVYTNGAMVSVSADPAYFSHWSSDYVSDIDDSSSPSTTFRMPDGVATLTPVYLEPDLYVDASMPDDSQDGTTWATAKQTIQAAAGLVASNGTIWVTNGVYEVGGVAASGETQVNRVCLVRPSTLRSVNGAEVTTIRGAIGSQGTPYAPDPIYATRAVWLSTGSTVSGFTIESGCAYQSNGSGVWMGTGSTVEHCIIRNNLGAFAGGGVYLESVAELNNCTVETNEAAMSGGGVCVQGGTMNNCIIKANATDYEGGGIYLAGTANNCLVIDNSAPHSGGGIFVKSGSAFNCTVADNEGRRGAGVCMDSAGSAVYNSILIRNTDWDSTLGTGGNVQYNDGTVENNLIGSVYMQGGVSISSNGKNLLINPSLFSFKPGGYTTRDYSICRDRGDNTHAPAGPDLAGNDRIINGRVDMGAYEHSGVMADTNANAISDDWESYYYGMNMPPLDSLCSNGVNTVKEAYIAGFDPTDPKGRFVAQMETSEAGLPRVRWSLAQGRTYSVLWTSSLTNSFTWIADIPWTEGEFIDEGHTEKAAGFYKIEVREED